LDNTLPKKIWILWLQGLDNAPLLVRNCYASWVKQNSGWEITFLDQNNLHEYIELDDLHITKQAFSDVVRINLLAKYGGLWVDATCICTMPLDEWLPKYMGTGFFAFERPAVDRMMGPWFLAGSQYNYIINALHTRINAYWKDNPGMVFIEDSKWKFLKKRLDRMNKKIWFGKLATRILKVYPYFWFHFLFEQIYLNDDRFKEMWDNTPKISADIPHTIFFAGMYKPLTEEVKDHIDLKVSPVYKVTWKYEPPSDLYGTNMGYLYNSIAD